MKKINLERSISREIILSITSRPTCSWILLILSTGPFIFARLSLFIITVDTAYCGHPWHEARVCIIRLMPVVAKNSSLCIKLFLLNSVPRQFVRNLWRLL